MKVPIIKGASVTLRPLLASDAKYFCQWFSDPEMTKFLQIYDMPAVSLKAEIDYIKKTKRSRERAQFIIIADDNEVIGTVSLNKINMLHRRAEYGIFIGNKKYWGQGYGTEAGQLVIRYAFQKLKLHRVYLTVIAYNIRGIKSYQKIGFVKEGELKEHLYRNGCYHNYIYMGILRNEYLKINHKKYARRKKS